MTRLLWTIPILLASAIWVVAVSDGPLKIKPSDINYGGNQEQSEVINLWPGEPPGPALNVGEEKDFYKPSDKRIAGRKIIKLGNVSTPQAHVFLPDEKLNTGTAVVVCPGGGFSILAWDLEGTEVAEWLNSIGVAAIVLKYRVPTRTQAVPWKAPVQDAQRTISLVRSRAKDWKLESDQIGILGFSAGGITAVRTSLASERHYGKSDVADDFSCKPDFSILVYSGGVADSSKTKLLSDINIDSKTPPAFMVHAFDDFLPVENAVLYMQALKKENVPSELHLYDAGGHGFGLRPVAEFPITQWPALCEKWLSRRGWLTRE
ncbi:MAG: alpha/beta hydrolase [Mariniblastus sp.]